MKRDNIILFNSSAAVDSPTACSWKYILNYFVNLSNSYVRRPKESIDDPNKSSTIQCKLCFYQAVLESKFLLCPSGQEFDTSRLLLGAIPIVESSPGLDRTYSDLPVLIVSNFSQVTPQLLNIAYIYSIINNWLKNIGWTW